MVKYTKLPAISGKKLIRLLLRDRWTIHRRTRHGIALIKATGDHTRVAVIQDTRADLPDGTLSKILGRDQTGIGKKGLLDLINKYGL